MNRMARLRPIAPRPAEGAPVAKDKIEKCAEGAASALAKDVPAPAEPKFVSDGEERPSAREPVEVSLDPSHFCYPELKPGKDLCSTSHGACSQGYAQQPFGQGPFGQGIPHASSCGNIQYVGNACHPGVFSQGNGCSMQWAGANQYGGPAAQYGSLGGGLPLGSGGSDAQIFGGMGVACSMKLDLDRDSVAKALREVAEKEMLRQQQQQHAACGSDESADTLEPGNAGAAPCVKKEAGSGSSDNENSRVLEGGMPCSGSRTDMEHKSDELRGSESPGGVVRPRSKAEEGGEAKTPNPLFRVKSQVACSYVAEFLKQEHCFRESEYRDSVQQALSLLERVASAPSDLQNLSKQKRPRQ